MPDNTLSTLSNIRIKVRRLTRNPSVSQITDDQIDDYINTFILYDMPASIKLEQTKETLSFYSDPNVDTYETNTADPDDPMYNFSNRYVEVSAPAYVAGQEITFLQDKESFYSLFPRSNQIETIAYGDTLTTLFTGTFSSYPILENETVFSSVAINGNPLKVYDDGAGNLIGDVAGAANTINYVTGAYSFNFSVAPGNLEAIYGQYSPYESSTPDTMLFYDSKFILRPVPDKTYKIDVECIRRPTELLDNADMPQPSELFSYIAYGAAIKILQDKLDMESVALLQPEFKNQEILVMRRIIAQNSQKRAATIYSQYGFNSDIGPLDDF